MPVCPKCKGDVPNESAFCNRCGSSLNVITDSDTTQSAPATAADVSSLKPAPETKHNNDKTAFYFLGFVLSVIVLGVIFWTYNSMKTSANNRKALDELIVRPSEVTEQNIKTLCDPVDKCVGKFVVWEGIVSGNATSGTNKIMVHTFNGRANLNLYPPLDGPVHEGDKILFHGFIRELNSFDPDEISYAYVRTTLETAAQVKADEDKKQSDAKAKEEADQEAADVQAASEMGVSLSEYKNAKSKISWASASCQNALIRQNEWGGDTEMDNYTWTVQGGIIDLHGNDVKLKNGFGAEGRVSYACIYDMKTDTASAFVQ